MTSPSGGAGGDVFVSVSGSGAFSRGNVFGRWVWRGARAAKQGVGRRVGGRRRDLWVASEKFCKKYANRRKETRRWVGVRAGDWRVEKLVLANFCENLQIVEKRRGGGWE